jgi:CheY-like chemotaxis protein
VHALVVEDNPSAIELLRVRLETLGVTMDATGDPAEVIRLMQARRPHFVLLDLRLGGSDPSRGVDVLYKLRSTPELADVPVVIHSIYVKHASDAVRLTSKADGILPKPFKFLDLQKLVEELRAAEAAKP